MNICIHTISHLTKVPRMKDPVVLSCGSTSRLLVRTHEGA